jgi:hypothetical protein
VGQNCVSSGQYINAAYTQMNSTISTCSPVDPAYYQFPSCFPNDATISTSSETSGCAKLYTAGPQGGGDDDSSFPAFSYCYGQLLNYFGDMNDSFAGCKPACDVNGTTIWSNCTTSYFDSNCDKQEGLYVTLTLVTSCSSIGYKNEAFYFYDSMKTTLEDSKSENFIVLGGFAASLERNIMDISLKSFHLLALPLTNDPTTTRFA